jgi:hypothetical protein
VYEKVYAFLLIIPIDCPIIRRYNVLYYDRREHILNIVGNDNVDKISNNYIGMNDTGKEKLIKVAECFLKIKDIIDEKIISNEENKIKEFKDE